MFYKKYYFLVKICNFSKFKKFSDFLQKFTIKVEKTFSRKYIIWYALYSKIATSTDFEKETKKIGRVVKTAFSVSRGTFCGTFFLKKL